MYTATNEVLRTLGSQNSHTIGRAAFFTCVLGPALDDAEGPQLFPEDRGPKELSSEDCGPKLCGKPLGTSCSPADFQVRPSGSHRPALCHVVLEGGPE